MNFKEHSEVERPTWLGAGWTDRSWHNDAMPHCALDLTEDKDDGPEVEIWVNYPDPEEREIGDLYGVYFHGPDAADNRFDVTFYQGDDEARAMIWERAARHAKSMIQEILKRNLQGAGDLHGLEGRCDVNVLGDSDALIDEGEAHRTPDDDPEVSITGWTNEVHEAAFRIVDVWLSFPVKETPLSEKQFEDTLRKMETGETDLADVVVPPPVGKPYVMAREYQVKVSLGKRRETLTVWGRTEAEAVECARHTFASTVAADALRKMKAEVAK